MYLENILIGKTEIGQSNSLALSNLKPGEKRLKVVCTIAPDDVGTYEVLFEDGITFSDGSSSTSGVLPQGGSVEWTITIPKKDILGRSAPKIRVTPMPNAFIEE